LAPEKPFERKLNLYPPVFIITRRAKIANDVASIALVYKGRRWQYANR